MSSAPPSPSVDCIALAVALHQAPGRFADLLHGQGKLPSGVGALLQLAAGSGEHATEFSLYPFLPHDELQEAAMFFIEQVLLAHGADHYRVLGVTPGAPLDEIKDNHRQLMRLFHPDRHLVPDAEAAANATRINQAYSILRSPDARARYDLGLAPNKSATTPVPYAAARIRQGPARPTLTLPPFVVRHLTAFALGSTALVAATGIGIVYLSSGDSGAIGGGSSYSRAADAPAMPRSATAVSVARSVLEASPPDRPASLAPAGSEPAAVALAGPVNLGTASGSVDEPIPVPARPVAEHIRGVPMPRPGMENARSHQRDLASINTLGESPPPTPRSPGIMEPASPTEPLPIAQRTARPAPEPPHQLPKMQLAVLVASLSQHYQQGDLSNLLELFDEAARIERGDRTAIRSEYRDLFNSSEARTLHIWDMEWNSRDDIAHGEGQFQARVWFKGEPGPRVYSGWIAIDVVQRHNRPLIVGLYHKAN